jgi:DNA-binding NarL/FixJ family response regulator
MNSIKVFHVEDYKIMRDGIKNLLSKDLEIEMVGEAKNADELMEALIDTPVDIIILDIFLDSMEAVNATNGFEICRMVRVRYPTIKIIAHSVYDDADRVARILKEGAVGFVSKKSGFEELVRAIKAVYAGEIYICSETSSRLKNLNKFLMGIESNLRAKEEVFSSREREVLEFLAKGRSSKEIADSLFVTERTIESHRKNMLEKANVKNTVELIAYASSLGLIKK